MKRMVLMGFAALLLTACQETLEERCARETREYTEKNCPTLVGRGVTLDSMTFDVATHTISYLYTLEGVLDDSVIVNANNPRERLLMEVKNNTHLKLYKEADYSFRYVYFSTKNNGTQLFEATFHANDYQ